MPDLYRFERCEVRPGERQLLVDGVPAAQGGRPFDPLVTPMERHVAGYKGLVECASDVAAALASSFGEHALAARFHGAAQRQLREARICHDPADEASIAPRIAYSRAALGDAAFETAKAEGSTLGYEASMGELDRWLGVKPARS